MRVFYTTHPNGKYQLNCAEITKRSKKRRVHKKWINAVKKSLIQPQVSMTSLDKYIRNIGLVIMEDIVITGVGNTFST